MPSDVLFWPGQPAAPAAPPAVAMVDSLVHSASWLPALSVCGAVLWLFYRAYQVLAKPVDELVNLLGLEMPPAPVVSLAAVKANGVVLHWKPPGLRGSVAKYQVRLNGHMGMSPFPSLFRAPASSPQERSACLTD
ncbi:hypothetical protein BDY21DRAFT_98221 [Lineolata rhizophorae]|uniref:Fibronectin type-III domain-containing protein n=1 Tax=Lineolata rhizophorae TaxID=578093 RepID=A0A6A6NSY8_9PEZI|nr:hypothetical protein BDY21DRAFT_98221 [Lineolata rhizophorae]